MSKPYLTKSSKPPASNAESIKCVWACQVTGQRNILIYSPGGCHNNRMKPVKRVASGFGRAWNRQHGKKACTEWRNV
jgi:hypothetical protein